MTIPARNAARVASGALSARGARQEHASRLLRGLLHEHDVSQDELAAVLGVEQSRVSRWADPRVPETIPLHDVEALCCSDVPRVVALGRALLRAVALASGVGTVELPPAGRWSGARAAARLVREVGEAAAETFEAIDDDGMIDAGEGARIVEGCDEALPALLALRAVGLEAQRERVAPVVEMARGRAGR